MEDSYQQFLVGKRITWGSGCVSYIVDSVDDTKLTLLTESAVFIDSGVRRTGSSTTTTTIDTAKVGPVRESKIPCKDGLRVQRLYYRPRAIAQFGSYGRVKKTTTQYIAIEWEGPGAGITRVSVGEYNEQFVVAEDQDVLPEGINREMKPGKPAEQSEPLIATTTKTITNILPGTYGALNIHEFNDNRFARLSIVSTPFNTAGLDHLISQLQFLRNILESNREAD